MCLLRGTPHDDLSAHLVRTVREVAMLLALMFKYSCEQCVFVLFDAVEGGHKIVHSLKDDFILKNMDQVCGHLKGQYL